MKLKSNNSNNDQTSLQSKGVINLGNYRGVSLKVEADGSIRGGDFTITGRKRAGVANNDPDYETLTYHPALILRAGLKDPASIISVGNVTARGGGVDFSTNGNIFTGNIDVSPDNPFPVYGYGTQRITLKGYNIFTGNLNAGSDVAPGVIVYQAVPYYDSRCYLSDLSDFLDSYVSCGVAASETIRVPSGSISLDATQYLRTGDISTRSRTSRGGNVTIQATDAIVGAIDSSGAMWFGGNVSVKTDVPFEHGAIMTDGTQKGIVEIGALDTPTDGANAIELQDLPSFASSKDADTVRQNVLTLLTARRLAGQKMTAQEIADKLDISIEEAEIAVLSPIGDDIKVDTPDLSRLSQNGRETSGFVLPIVVPIVIIGFAVGVTLYIYVNNGDAIVRATDKGGRILWEKTGDAAQNFIRRYLPNISPVSQDHGGGKNSQHGKSEDRPSDIAKLKELEEQLKGATGKLKVKIQNKINNLKKAIAARKKGENHSQNAKK